MVKGCQPSGNYFEIYIQFFKDGQPFNQPVN
jgi:hypothetical protein